MHGRMQGLLAEYCAHLCSQHCGMHAEHLLAQVLKAKAKEAAEATVAP
jgi:hypothetical protein